ncbi:MAG: hypothetical protein ACTHKK_12420 [Candidatus Nitrosocosmicus sp.]
MTDIIDKVKEKTKDVKDSIVDNTKNVVNVHKTDQPLEEGHDSRYQTASVTEQYNTTTSSTSEDSIRDTSSGTKDTFGNSGIVDWDSIIHNGVRTKDMQDVGNVTAVTDTSIVITSEGARDEFNVPKEEVEGFNGAEVTLNTTLDRFEQFKIKVPR